MRGVVKLSISILIIYIMFLPCNSLIDLTVYERICIMSSLSREGTQLGDILQNIWALIFLYGVLFFWLSLCLLSLGLVVLYKEDDI